MKFYNGGVSIDMLAKAPRYFINCCIEDINDEARRIDKENRKILAQQAINKMKGKR